MDDITKKKLALFIRRIYEIRTDADQSQTMVSDNLSVSRDAYGRYERGERIPQVDFLLDFCRHFNVSSDYVLGLSDAWKTLSPISISSTTVPLNSFGNLTKDEFSRLQSINDLSKTSILEILDLIEFKLSRENKSAIQNATHKTEAK